MLGPYCHDLGPIFPIPARLVRGYYYNIYTTSLYSWLMPLNIRKDDSEKSLGFKMKSILKPNAVPIIFKSSPPQTKKLKRHNATKTTTETMAPDHQNTDNSRHEEKTKKLLGYVQRKLKLVGISLKGGNFTQKTRKIA